MQYKSAAIIVAGLAAQQVAAFGWSDAGPFSCPGNTNNKCSDSQQGGYDWSSLPAGSFNSYGSNQFSGFQCSNSFGKRDLLSKRGFQSKCITGNLDDHPSMSCNDNEGMSIDQMQISSSVDTEVDCVYSMPDGSECHETHSCSQGGSIFQNSQCGGAKSVTFKPGKGAAPGCSIGVHSVGFHCGPPSSTVPASVPPTSSSPPTPSSVPPASSSPPTPSSVPPYSGCTGPQCSSSPSAPVSSSPPVSSVPPYSGCTGPACSSTPSSPPQSSLGCYGGNCGSSSSVHPVSSSAPVPGCYGSSCSSTQPVASSAPSPSSVQPVPSSSPVPGCYGSTCGSSSSVQPASSSAPSPGCYGSGCSSQGVPTYGSSSSPVSPASSTSPPSYPTPQCPGLLPRCLNTWMYMSGCKDNADSNCFCGNEKFIKNVMGCISAWGGSDSETQAAASYLMGLCANHVSTNPAIITACPSTVTPAPSPAGFTPSSVGPITSAPTPGNTAPCTTITYSSSVIIPATFSTGVSSGLTCPGSSITTSLITTVTVPQVQITTSTVTAAGTTTQSVGLGAGSPAPAPAYTTPGGSSAGAVPTGYGTTFGTSFAATPSASSSPIVPATGAGVKTGFSLGGFVLGAIAALAAL